MKNITPQHLRCSLAMSCPSVHRFDNGDLLVIGECVKEEAEKNGITLGQNETAIIISPEYFAEIK